MLENLAQIKYKKKEKLRIKDILREQAVFNYSIKPAENSVNQSVYGEKSEENEKENENFQKLLNSYHEPLNEQLKSIKLDLEIQEYFINLINTSINFGLIYESESKQKLSYSYFQLASQISHSMLQSNIKQKQDLECDLEQIIEMLSDYNKSFGSFLHQKNDDQKDCEHFYTQALYDKQIYEQFQYKKLNQSQFIVSPKKNVDQSDFKQYFATTNVSPKKSILLSEFDSNVDSVKQETLPLNFNTQNVQSENMFRTIDTKQNQQESQKRITFQDLQQKMIEQQQINSKEQQISNQNNSVQQDNSIESLKSQLKKEKIQFNNFTKIPSIFKQKQNQSLRKRAYTEQIYYSGTEKLYQSILFEQNQNDLQFNLQNQKTETFEKKQNNTNTFVNRKFSDIFVRRKGSLVGQQEKNENVQKYVQNTNLNMTLIYQMPNTNSSYNNNQLNQQSSTQRSHEYSEKLREIKKYKLRKQKEQEQTRCKSQVQQERKIFTEKRS
ncbi:hypothetical protein PPERSA_04104 [Pseudocohnilembus persalinus]|uniref:Uncharacterized protein n=1 Tax=Pseudocohnilembus persalinus TaxID=266149 RepID=A0A0V0QLR3_PSEPJ|nr:hypothetical protein PPERSA_04104 [Pseudocohnilembus persalinus]|eukprot:KRX02901.1 hypothetical protein PPERSA_04104 [Pseudocohnilembus persalinus]